MNEQPLNVLDYPHLAVVSGRRQTGGNELQNRRLQVRFLSHLPLEIQKRSGFDQQCLEPLRRIWSQWQQKWQQS